MTRTAPRVGAPPFPRRLILELVNTCNLDCPMCRIGRHGVNPRRFMARRLFDDVAEQIFPRIDEVRLNGLGEATLLPYFADCVRTVRAAGLHGELITNLSCDTAILDELLLLTS